MRGHIDHVLEHLARVREGHTAVANPEAVYLGGEDGDSFQELVGLRLSGCPVVTLAALRFHRHELPGIPWARESLGSYLSAPPAPRTTDEVGAIAALLPNAHEKLPAFLRGLRGGRAPAPLHLDPRRIEAAFDFRPHNPSALEALRRSADPLRTYLFRTAGGHVLRGRSNGVRSRRAHASPFFAVRDAVQITPEGERALPTVVLQRAWLTLTLDVTDEAVRLAAANHVPFLPDAASPEGIFPLPRG